MSITVPVGLKQNKTCNGPHAWPIKRTQTENKVVAMTVDLRLSDAPKTPQILKGWRFTHIFTPAAQKTYTVSTISRCVPEISVTLSVPHQMRNTIPIAPSPPELRCWERAKKVLEQNNNVTLSLGYKMASLFLFRHLDDFIFLGNISHQSSRRLH